MLKDTLTAEINVLKDTLTGKINVLKDTLTGKINMCNSECVKVPLLGTPGSVYLFSTLTAY